MGRKRTGTVEQRGGKMFVRLTVDLDNGKKGRRRAPIAGARTKDEAKVRKARVAAKAEGMTFAANTAPTITFRDYLNDLWIPSRKRKGLSIAGKDEERLRLHVVPLLGDLPMQDICEDDLRDLVEQLDEKILDESIRFSWRTGRHVWRTTRKLLKDACRAKLRALRVLTVDPSINVEGPDEGAEKSKQWLYPREFADLMACADVPLRWRRIYAVTTLLFLRWGETRALAWRDLDLVHGIAHIHEQVDNETGKIGPTKMEDVRDVPIEPSLMPLLKAMRRERPDDERIFESIDKPSEELRDHLMRAGVTRSALHQRAKTSLAIRFHDLRATGITWMAIRGDSPMRIRERAGHANFSQTEEYIRRAELVGPNVGRPFPALPPSVIGSIESSQDSVPGGLAKTGTDDSDSGFGVRRRGLEALPNRPSVSEGGPSTGNQVGVGGAEPPSGTILGTKSRLPRLPGRRPRPSVQAYVAKKLREAYPHVTGSDPEKVLRPLERAARAIVRGRAPRAGAR